ncbi:MAG: glycerate kinase [Sciscionella sp.]
MHVVVAPDKFKGSLPAAGVADAVAAGIYQVRPELPVRCVPVADGGDGTLEAVVAAGYRRYPVTVSGPTGQPVRSAIAIRERTAVVELADGCGLARLPGGRREPLRASSYGAGELVTAALDRGARTIVLGVGGSASTDGGAGMLAALGAKIFDAEGRVLPQGGGALPSASRLELSTMDPRLRHCQIMLASDVDNPLLGTHGAAAVYGQQKGANHEQVRMLEDGLRWWSRLMTATTGRDRSRSVGAGAAGGVGFGALAALGARRCSGIGAVLALVGMSRHLRGARLVITGEGSLDSQSLHGKAPVGVAEAAYEAGVPAVAVAGRCTLSPPQRAAARLRAVYALTDIEPDVERCISEAPALLRTLGERIALSWLAGDEGDPAALGATRSLTGPPVRAAIPSCDS